MNSEGWENNIIREIEDSGLRRIALFSGNYNYVMDGPVRALNRLVGFLEQQGVEVLVFAPTTKKPAFQHTGTLVSVPSVPIPGRSEYRVALGLPRRIRKIVEDFKPDLVHLAAPDFLGTAALKWACSHNIPAVSSFHTRFDTYPRYYKMRWLEKYLTNHMRRFYHRCEQVYVPSQSMIEVLKEQHMARRDEDLRIWSRGVEASLFNPDRRSHDWRRKMGIADSDIVIAFAGRLVLEKGLDVYAKVMDELQNRGLPVRVLVIGDGPERERFESWLTRPCFTGFLSAEALATAYASADIFFNASITETFGNVTLEAMASKLPCVCADATGSRTLVEHSKSGYLVEPGNIKEFADCIENMIKDKALYNRLAEESLRRSHDYSWDAVLGALLSQYIEAVNTYKNKGRTGADALELSKSSATN